MPLTQSPNCPSLSALPTEEQSASCRHLTELRNLTKGPCYLDQVEVSYCRGHCPSSTNVMPEVSKGLLRRPRGAHSALAPKHRTQQSPGDTRDMVDLLWRQWSGLHLLLGPVTLVRVGFRSLLCTGVPFCLSCCGPMEFLAPSSAHWAPQGKRARTPVKKGTEGLSQL